MVTREIDGRALTGEMALDIVQEALDRCGLYNQDCHNCPIYRGGNDRQCAYYLAGIILDADWSDCVRDAWNVFPKRYARDCDAVQPV